MKGVKSRNPVAKLFLGTVLLMGASQLWAHEGHHAEEKSDMEMSCEKMNHSTEQKADVPCEKMTKHQHEASDHAQMKH